ncbi:hypothetical protein [Aeromonas hydrophila]|uniref:hypothetical protein n=1 Tax=Aeromonas hydrophila TaxID=644 RepID=UPI0021E6C8B7|nr:hypothetical protein [Aeromonas hydrophila]MCV3277475.1 hypothetical protein [Aeromonas hydrophila]
MDLKTPPLWRRFYLHVTSFISHTIVRIQAPTCGNPFNPKPFPNLSLPTPAVFSSPLKSAQKKIFPILGG